ncbi:MAG: T9SS type A sorting domain-containing protein [candidate division WOR-3 bacterium]
MNSPNGFKMRVHNQIGIEENAVAPARNLLFAITPNPGRNGRIILSLGPERPTRINVFNSAGKKVATITGQGRILWKTDKLPAGIYFLRPGNSNLTKKLILIQ